MRPIRPEEVEEGFPEVVVKGFNELIRENYRNGQAVVKVSEVEGRIESLSGGMMGRAQIRARRYLDVEGMYRRAGWEVRYESPDPGEGWEAYFVFRKGGRG